MSVQEVVPVDMTAGGSYQAFRSAARGVRGGCPPACDFLDAYRFAKARMSVQEVVPVDITAGGSYQAFRSAARGVRGGCPPACDFLDAYRFAKAASV